MKRKLIKFSNYSFCITLPKKAVEQLGWGKGEEVDVTFDSKKRRILVNKSSTIADKDKNMSASKKTPKESSTKDDIQPIPKLRW
jgi:bifunctional DNA-binding transcriptional regulator/antitoxin component of YhaV-PrlF toxin-antitoxin module